MRFTLYQHYHKEASSVTTPSSALPPTRYHILCYSLILYIPSFPPVTRISLRPPLTKEPHDHPPSRTSSSIDLIACPLGPFDSGDGIGRTDLQPHSCRHSHPCLADKHHRVHSAQSYSPIDRTRSDRHHDRRDEGEEPDRFRDRLAGPKSRSINLIDHFALLGRQSREEDVRSHLPPRDLDPTVIR